MGVSGLKQQKMEGENEDASERKNRWIFGLPQINLGTTDHRRTPSDRKGLGEWDGNPKLQINTRISTVDAVSPGCTIILRTWRTFKTVDHCLSSVKRQMRKTNQVRCTEPTGWVCNATMKNTALVAC
jgi:hypothetical protein